MESRRRRLRNVAIGVAAGLVFAIPVAAVVLVHHLGAALSQIGPALPILVDSLLARTTTELPPGSVVLHRGDTIATLARVMRFPILRDSTEDVIAMYEGDWTSAADPAARPDTTLPVVLRSPPGAETVVMEILSSPDSAGHAPLPGIVVLGEPATRYRLAP